MIEIMIQKGIKLENILNHPSLWKIMQWPGVFLHVLFSSEFYFTSIINYPLIINSNTNPNNKICNHTYQE